jgi:hypothetical protein
MTEQRTSDQCFDAKVVGSAPAFPFTYEARVNQECGLTKRELFAAMAMQGVMTGLGMNAPKFGPDEPVDVEVIAIDAVKMADALLAELAR